MPSVFKYLRKYVICLCILLLHSFLFAQNRIIDSLNKLASSSSNDSITSLVLTELAANYIGYDTTKCGVTLEEVHRIILNHKNWDYNWGYYYEIKSQVIFGEGKYDYSLLLEDSAIVFYKRSELNLNGLTKKHSIFRIAAVTAAKGSSYSMTGNNDNAIKFLLNALRLYEQSDHPDKFTKLATCYNDIATTYYGMQQYEKSMEYDVKAIPFHLLVGDNESISSAYIYAASDFSMLKQFDSAEAYFLKAAPHVKELNKPSVNIEYYGKIGGLYWTQKNWPKAIEFYNVAYQNAQKINDWYNQAAYLRGIGDSYYFADNLQKAEEYSLKAQIIDEKNNFPREKRQLYNLLSLIYFKKNDYKNAYIYTKKYISENIKINNDENKKTIAELDKKYQSVQKEKEIVKLNADKQIQLLSIQQKSTLNYILIGSLAAILIVVFLGYRNLRNRQQLAKQQDELQQQRISELEKDKQLVAVDAMLQGQEEERSRLAKDLHDGLGGLLSGVKFSLSNMKDNLIITPDNMAVFERSLDMLDTSIKELRRVAHNMMPEMLTKFGLDEALKEYCNTVNATALVSLKYQSLGMETRLDSAIEIIIYRIIQELLNNILKHAVASEALVQLIKENNRINIVVEDNGKGFDTALLEKSKGAGWVNIRSRVEYIKGQLDIHSEPGKGTLINIECPLAN